MRIDFGNRLMLCRFTFLARRWHEEEAETETRMKRLILALLLSNFLTPLAARRLTLDDCMAYAVAHSTAVGQRQADLDSRRAELGESVAALFPSVSASSGGTTNFGRSIDPATNTYTNTSTFGNTYALSGSMPLFAGLQGINAVRAAKVARSMGAADLEAARDEAALQTMNAYMDVVYYDGAVRLAREQLATSRETLRQVRRLEELGRKSAADVAEIESQEAGFDYLLTEQQNNLDLARIRLREVMNYPQHEPLEIETAIDLEARPVAATIGEVLDHARGLNPQLRAAALNSRYQQLQYARAKGGYAPSLYLYGGYNTSFYTDFDNRSAYDRFWTQFRNNRGSYVQVGLSVPLFSGLYRRTNKRRARNALRSAELQQQAVERSVESEIARTYRQMEGYGKQFVQGDKKVRAAQLAYDGVARKFEKGLASAIELRTAANTLLQAQSERLQARLQYIVKCRMVDYYNGTPLVENR